MPEPETAWRSVSCRPSESVKAAMSRVNTAVIVFPPAHLNSASFSPPIDAPCSNVAEVGGGSDGPAVEGGEVGGCHVLRAVSVFRFARNHHPPARIMTPTPTI